MHLHTVSVPVCMYCILSVHSFVHVTHIILLQFSCILIFLLIRYKGKESTEAKLFYAEIGVTLVTFCLQNKALFWRGIARPLIACPTVSPSVLYSKSKTCHLRPPNLPGQQAVAKTSGFIMELAGIFYPLEEPMITALLEE